MQKKEEIINYLRDLLLDIPDWKNKMYLTTAAAKHCRVHFQGRGDNPSLNKNIQAAICEVWNL